MAEMKTITLNGKKYEIPGGNGSVTSGGVVYVTFTKNSDGEYSCSHTVADIKAMVDAGMLVLGMEKINTVGDWMISQISVKCEYAVGTAGYIFSGRYEASQDGLTAVQSKLYALTLLKDGTEECQVIEGQYFMSSVPIMPPTTDDVGKFLTYDGGAMVWAEAGAALPDAEEASF